MSLQPFMCEYFGVGSAGFVGECCWPGCHDFAEWMEMRTGPKRRRLWSYCEEHARIRQKEIDKVTENERLTKRNEVLEEHVRKLRKGCELALFGVTKDADTNDGTVDRAGIAETMRLVLWQTKEAQ